MLLPHKLTLACFFSTVVLSSIGQELTDSFPQDVKTYIERRELCEHFRGEYPEPEGWGDPYQERLLEVNKGIETYCKRADDDLALYKDKYKNDQAIMSVLNLFDQVGM